MDMFLIWVNTIYYYKKILMTQTIISLGLKKNPKHKIKYSNVDLV